MRISAYAIYIGACLLACGAALLSGIELVNAFNKQQQQSEATQLKAGMGQVTAFQTIIGNQMRRMRTTTDSNARTFFKLTSSMSDSTFAPETVINAMREMIFSIWAPSVKAVDQLNGYGLTFMYTNMTTGLDCDRTFQVYWDLRMSGEYEYAFAFTSLEDGLCHAWRLDWVNYSTPVLAAEMYAFDAHAIMARAYNKDDFFDYAQPWSSSDGNSYWCFTHMRAFFQHGVWINFQSWDVGVSWLDMMRSVLTDGANFVAFDSQKFVMATTNADEAHRLANCRGLYANGTVPGNCIDSPANQHPIWEIREIYTALYHPAWDDLSAGPIAPTITPLSLQGRQYLTITSTLFSTGKDNFRVTLVWYQPCVCVRDDVVGLAALICIMTLVSTFVLTALGIFGVLRPLMALGAAMRAVACTLTDLDREVAAVLQPRPRSLFHEVEAIGRDFETIVVDFLGFSSTNARDNRYAPKDPNRPFAVLFTDIQASTRLWGKDPAEMSRCVQTHHDLIRRLIRAHHLYEVKTVGDSFMVTTGSAEAAVLFALDLQTAFHAHDWGWDGADDLYREAAQAFVKAPPGLPRASEYSKLWNGLRVRVGAHYGTGRVTYDAVTKGFDYYGTVVNAAARIEAIAHGGQIVVSEDLINALPAPLDPSLGLIYPLGPVPLRGVLDPPALLEVKPTGLQARAFPPLRVECKQEELCRMEHFSTEGNSPKNILRPRPRLSVIVVDGPERSSLESVKDQQSSNSVGSHTLERPAVAQIAEDFARVPGLSPPPHWLLPFQSRVAATF